LRKNKTKIILTAVFFMVVLSGISASGLITYESTELEKSVNYGEIDVWTYYEQSGYGCAQSLPFTKVRLVSIDGLVIRHGRTDASGDYTFKMLPLGHTYIIRASKIGWLAGYGEATLTENNDRCSLWIRLKDPLTDVVDASKVDLDNYAEAIFNSLYNIDINTMTIEESKNIMYQEALDSDVLSQVEEAYQEMNDIGVTDDMTIAESKYLIEEEYENLNEGLFFGKIDCEVTYEMRPWPKSYPLTGALLILESEDKTIKRVGITGFKGTQTFRFLPLEHEYKVTAFKFFLFDGLYKEVGSVELNSEYPTGHINLYFILSYDPHINPSSYEVELDDYTESTTIDQSDEPLLPPDEEEPLPPDEGEEEADPIDPVVIVSESPASATVEEGETIEFTVETTGGSGNNYYLFYGGDGGSESGYMGSSAVISYTYTSEGTFEPDFEVHDLDENNYDSSYNFAFISVAANNNQNNPV